MYISLSDINESELNLLLSYWNSVNNSYYFEDMIPNFKENNYISR